MTSEELAELQRRFIEQGGQVSIAVPRGDRASVVDDLALVQAIRQRAEAGAGVMAVSKALRHSTRTINTLADRHGIVFASSSAASTIERNRRLRAALAPKVQRLANRGLIQVDIAAQLRITRAVVRRIAAEYGININSRAR